MIPKSKKARALIVSVLVIVIGTVLTHLGVELTPEQSLALNELSGAVVALVSGIYMLAQGIADGQSGGKTSANYNGDNISAETLQPMIGNGAGNTLRDVAVLFKELGLNVTGSKKQKEESKPFETNGGRPEMGG